MGGLFRSFFAPFSLLVFASFLVPIFGPLGCLLGVPFGSLWIPKLPHVGSKMALETHLLFKSGFCKKVRKTQWFLKVFAPEDSSENAPRWPKIAPRRSWRGTFSMSKPVLDFGASRAPFWVPFGFPFRSQEVPKRFRKAIQNLSKFSVRSPKKGAPKRPQEAPKRLPRRTQEVPRGPQDAPREPQGGSQEAPKRTSRGTKKLLR